MMKMRLSGGLAIGLAGIGVLMLGLFLGWIGRGLLSYHTNVATVGTFYDWRTACPAAQDTASSCQIIQDVLEPRSHSEIAQVAVLRDNGNLVMGITLPYDVLLQPGLGLTVGTAPQKIYQFRTCNTVGCLVVVPFDKALSQALDQAKDAHLVFAGLDNKAVSVPFSMKGYVDASRAFMQDEAKRKSWVWRLWS